MEQPETGLSRSVILSEARRAKSKDLRFWSKHQHRS